MDVAGLVEEVGKGVTAFKKGDRVAAIAPGFPMQSLAHAGFQLYPVIPTYIASHIPDTLSFTSAAVLPLGLATAGAGLFQPEFLGLSLPNTQKVVAENAKHVVLIWGGSGSVGSCAIQLCAAAGLTVLTTCSPKNFTYVQDLGATYAFDYNDAAILHHLITAVQGMQVLGAYDTVSSTSTTLVCANFLHALGGGKVVCTRPDLENIKLPEGVQRLECHPPRREEGKEDPIWTHVWSGFMGEGLMNGKLRAKPEAVIVKGGLERLQDGLDLFRKGVSAGKVVVEI